MNQQQELKNTNDDNILIAYSTTDGQTRKICQRIQKTIEVNNRTLSCRLLPLSQVTSIDLEAADKIIIGASIHYGKHAPEVYAFTEQYKQQLDSKVNAFFSVNLVARKAEKCQPDTNPYLVKFLKQIDWQPQNLAAFAGMVDYPKYKFWDRQMIRLIMWMTKGPTNSDAVIEYTNWQAVTDFANDALTWRNNEKA